TTQGVTTNIDGKYTLVVKEDAQALIFRFVGMATQEVTIGASNVIDVVMKSEMLDIEGVVITALGISREKKSLGYAVEDVKGDDLMNTRPTNVIDALSGKISGVQVVSASGAVGASSRINIRGNSSLRGDNQPLFVIDGVPMSNYSSEVGQYGDVDYGNAAMDIDPENIESMSVLKGAGAAALYGSRALNGVIIITTKKGKGVKKGLGIQYTYNIGMDNAYILPTYQNKYGQGTAGDEYTFNQYQNDPDNTPYGSYQEYAQNESFNYYDGNWGGVNDGWDESWGPRLDAGLKLNQFNSPYTLDANGNPVYEATPWISQPDNVKNFFETGINQTHNIAITSNGEKASGRFSYTNNTVKGVVPNTDLKKNSFNFNGGYKLSKRINVNASATYVKNQSDNLPGGGYGAENVMQSLGSWFGRQVNMDALRDNYDELDAFGKPYTWSYYYHNNPYWTLYKNTSSRDRDRLIGSADVMYKVNDWMNVNFRAGTDFWSEGRKSVVYDKSNQSKVGGGQFTQNERTSQENNVDFFINMDKPINDDLRISGLVGANYRENKYRFQEVSATELTVPNFFDIGNAKGSPGTDMFLRNRETNSIYSQVNLSYKEYLFVGGTFRNDWSSTLPTDENSYPYYSGDVGFIFSELLDINPNILSHGKLRASYATVGGDADPYVLANYFEAASNAFNGVSQYAYLRDLNNGVLKPEQKYATEFGLDLKFAQNRIGLDVTYYTEDTENQIMAVDISTATGFDSKWINAGILRNQGVEISGMGEILKSKDGLNWNINVKFAKNSNKMIELYKDLEKYQLGSAWSITTEARPNAEYGVMMGKAFERDANGAIIVDADGLPMRTADNVEVGNITPDFNWGVINTFSYKGVNLNVAIDGRQGGDIFSVTKMFGLYSGVLEQTAQGDIREVGVIAGQNVMTNENFVTEDGKVNDIRVSANDFYSNFYKLHEMSIIDGSFIKLREISLDYSLPRSIMKKISFVDGLNVSAYARNVALLWVHESNDVRIDPETGFGVSTGGIGFEQYQLPPTRTIGFKLTANF
ncbi:MAG: SusC/RagA family TonB-linked outer membrane protein, partial [Bacteroidales bacterium]|nr:SusC/RagA family TonB-linked outer membrane protein [Bacteroidales bacterium]